MFGKQILPSKQFQMEAVEGFSRIMETSMEMVLVAKEFSGTAFFWRPESGH